MKVAHFAEIRQTGQYATVADLIQGERLVGLDARLIVMSADVVPNEELSPASADWARTADVFVHHNEIPVDLQAIRKPTVLAMHGRPENSFILGFLGLNHVYAAWRGLAAEPNYKAFVTFWPENVYAYSMVIPGEKLHVIPPPVNLAEFTPEGERYDFGKWHGEPNIVVADLWREDTTPFNVLHAIGWFRHCYWPDAKAHVYGVRGPIPDPSADLVIMLHEAGIVGKASAKDGEHKMTEILRSADIVVTPHVIATRVVREALASGTPIVAGSGNKFTPYTANPWDKEAFAEAIYQCWLDIKMDRQACRDTARKTAELYFDTEETGRAMKQVLERIV